MDTSPYSIRPHFLCMEGTQNLEFGVQFDSWPWWKWHDVNNTILVDAARISPHHSYASEEGYKSLQQQWISLLVAQHPFPHNDRVLTIWYFGVQFESSPQQIWQDINNKEFVDAARSSSHLLCVSKEGHETLQQQWISFFIIASHFLWSEGTSNVTFCM